MPADIAALLTEAAWLTELARRLARDPAEAADAVQETWISAMRSPPDPDRPARPWLRRVLVNTLRMRHRARSRRVTHESAVPDPEVARPDEIVERAQVERRLAELVLALPEPQRTTVLLRYREGLTAEAIAKQQGIPAATVRTRLKAALDRLRGDLDGDGERKDWRGLFVPGVFIPSWGEVVMAKVATKAGVGVVVLLLVLALVVSAVWLHGRGDGGDETEASGGTSGSALRTRRAAAGRDPSTLFAQPGIPARAIAGRVTLDGAAYRGATVHLADAVTRTPLAEAVSDGDGTFAFGQRPAAEYVVVATTPAKTAASVAVDLRAGAAEHIELALVTCTTKLVGMVADASGGVIAHARVGRADAPWPAVDTDAGGHYELCLPFGYTNIEFSAAGYAGRLLEVDVDRVTRRDVALIPEATVAGTIVDGAGTPVGGAWVTIEPIVGNASEMSGLRDARVSGFADSDGTFRLDRVPAGRNRIRAYAADAITQSPVGVVAIAGRVVEGVVVRVETAGRISGFVVAGGVPVVGIAVGVRIGNRDALGPRSSNAARPVLARTYAGGRFEITGLPHDTLAITVADQAVIAPRSVHLGDRDVRVEIARPATITGRVLRHGKQVANAQVNCDNGINYYVRSDTDGRYVCPELAPGRYQVMASIGDGVWGVFDKPVAIAGGETVEQDIVLVYEADICGRVVDQSGRAYAVVEVRADDGNGDSAKAITDDDGRFCARFLSGGHYDVAAFANGQRLPSSTSSKISLAKPDGHAVVELVVERSEHAIVGVVLDSTGAPVPDAIVRATPARSGTTRFDASMPAAVATTSPTGEFRLSRITAGTYAVVATGRDGAEAIVDRVATGTTALAITLDAAGSIEGRLVGFTQTPTVIGAPLRGPGSAFEADRDGDRFRAAGLSPGVYIFTANTGLGESAAVEVTIKPGATATIELASEGTGVIVARVFDFTTHAPLAGQRCTVLAAVGDRVGAMYTEPDTGVRTGANGVFTIDPAPAGNVHVMCGGPGGGGTRFVTLAARQRLDVDVPIVPGEVRDLGIDFGPGGQIVALVPGGPGERAGLLAGDLIVAVDGTAVTSLSPPNIVRLIGRRSGASAALEVARGVQRVVLTIVVP